MPVLTRTNIGQDRIGRVVWGVCLRPPICWDSGFDFHRGHGCLS